MKKILAEYKSSLSNASIAFLLVITGFTALHWLILYFQIPIFDKLSDWKYHLRVTPVEPGWIVTGVLTLILAVSISFWSSKDLVKIIVIVIAGVVLQYSIAFSKGDGLDALSLRMQGKGHAEFAKVAARQLNMLTVAREYESFISEKYYSYLPSKPPGTLLFYMFTNKLAQDVWPSEDKEEHLVSLATFASLTWPLISCLAVIPLFFLARVLFDDPERGIVASLLYVSTPSLNLITLVTDQTLYPLLCLTALLLTVLACRQQSMVLAIVAGAFYYFTVYFSFGLAVVVVFFLLPVLWNVPDFSLRYPKDWIRLALGILFGIAIANFAAYYFLNYHIIIRYARAIENHLLWRGWDNTLATYFNAGFTDLTEFSVWIGLPLAIVFVYCVFDAIRRTFAGALKPIFVFNLSLVGIFIFLLVFGKTKAETARLWLFLVPFLCLSVAGYIKNQKLFVIAVLALEVGTTVLTLIFQNFS